MSLNYISKLRMLQFMKTCLFTLLLGVAICSCAQTTHQDAESVKGKTYTSDEVGWTIQIPEGWDIVPNEMIDKGDKGEVKQLITFRNNGGLFGATLMPFKEGHPDSYTDYLNQIHANMYQRFISRGVVVDTMVRKISLHGHEYDVFSSTIHAPDGAYIIDQLMYSCLVDGYEFSVNLNFNNDSDKATMLRVWENSKFQ